MVLQRVLTILLLGALCCSSIAAAPPDRHRGGPPSAGRVADGEGSERVLLALRGSRSLLQQQAHSAIENTLQEQEALENKVSDERESFDAFVKELEGETPPDVLSGVRQEVSELVEEAVEEDTIGDDASAALNQQEKEEEEEDTREEIMDGVQSAIHTQVLQSLKDSEQQVSLN